MADTKDSPSVLEKLLALSEKIFDALWSADSPHDTWHWVILILIVLIVVGVGVTIALKAMAAAVEQFIKLVEAYKSSGLPMPLGDASKSRVKRRKQFCGVLDADLAYLAKAENWNDQNFTDLEAEVETEGGYYASAWDRLKRRKSFGLRKEPSLIRAITSSAERAMQLVGEPGSGKSVALRHLAKQFAEQGRKSNDERAIVPLYVNLREIETDLSRGVTADDVREFVLDNIRRGDADTSAFVRENWDDYCNRGIWLFLFDSFDEIPAVLHAAVGSTIVRQYSQAIRQFLEGMGECKGILASREFKGPEALPWKKLRILPLSGEKQDELIQNSFLSRQQMGLVRQHLAISDSSIGATPLFLTLLCRFVRDEQKAPNNDHDILLQHIERLARREPEYLSRKYKLSVEELVGGAERLAQLFAEEDSLSLAPTLDQIIAHLPESEVPGGSIERLISALVDCKIGRADVPNAAHGDRRFAFAHRRYQEALFVRYLARHPGAFSCIELLTEPRWREYTVTLLQTRHTEEIQDLLVAACKMLEERSGVQKATCVVQSSRSLYLGYYEWDDEIAVPLIALLQEGLARRIQDVPAMLSVAVYHFLEPRWLQGDAWDRREVLRLGGLLPHDVLVEYLVASFANGTHAERLQAFKQAVFVSVLPDAARTLVLEMLSDEVLIAKTRADQLSVEALAARLPLNMGAGFVVSRGNRIRRQLHFFGKLGSAFRFVFPVHQFKRSIKLLSGFSFVSYEPDKGYAKAVPPIPLLCIPFIFLASIIVVLALRLVKESNQVVWVLVGFMIFAAISYSFMFFPFLVRAYGKKVNMADVGKWIYGGLTLQSLSMIVKLCAFFCVAIIAMWPVGYTTDWVARTSFDLTLLNKEHPTFFDLVTLGVVCCMFFIYAVGIPLFAVGLFKGQQRIRRWNKNLFRLKQVGVSDLNILHRAENIDELVGWIESDRMLLSDIDSIRGFSSFVLAIVRGNVDKEVAVFNDLPDCLSSDKFQYWKLQRVRQILEDRLDRFADRTNA